MLSPDTLRQRVQRRLEKQRVLVRELLERREQLQGSLFTRYGECRKPGCGCQEGALHGPYYVLSTRVGGKTGFAYLESERLSEARERVKSYREFRKGLRELKRLNEDIVSLLKRYQAVASRAGGRRLGLTATA